MRRGFTIVELLVASLLLSMLVSILTMMFNQSSIAWRTGTAGVVNLNQTRSSLGAAEDNRDSLLPGVGDNGGPDSRTLSRRTVSLWDKGSGNRLRSDRAFDTATDVRFSMNDAKTGKPVSVEDEQAGRSVSLYSVGVRSLGPDGLPDTPDDINTWPEEID